MLRGCDRAGQHHECDFTKRHEDSPNGCNQLRRIPSKVSQRKRVLTALASQQREQSASQNGEGQHAGNIHFAT